MLIFYLLFPSTQASDLSTSIGQTVGYFYIALTLLLILVCILLILLKPQAKGLKTSILQLIIFSQFSRYTALINFQSSTFYVTSFQIYFKSQFPLNWSSCSDPQQPWSTFGFSSTNFLCNSSFNLLIIGTVILVWTVLRIKYRKQKNTALSDIWVFIAYYSATDLSFSAFLQISTFSLDGSLNAISSICAIVYLISVLALVAFQGFYLYKGLNCSWLLSLITEEFEQRKDYQFYLFYPMLMFRILLHMCLTVFTQEYPYTVPIVVSITNVINFSYIVSMRPFTKLKYLIYVLAIQIIEIILMYVPLLYNSSAIPSAFIDFLTVLLFIITISVFSSRVFFLFTNPNNQSYIEPAVASDLRSNHELQNNSIIELVSNDPENYTSNGFVQTFKPRKKKKSKKIVPELVMAKPEGLAEESRKKGSYFVKTFLKDGKKGTGKPFEESESIRVENGEELAKTARFNDSGMNSEALILRMPDNTPVSSHTRIIQGFSEAENIDEEAYINKRKATDITPISNFSTGRTPKPRINLNRFTVKLKKDEDPQSNPE